MAFIHPSLFFLIAALALFWANGRVRPLLLLGMPALAFVSLLFIPEGNYGALSFLGYTLTPFRVDRLSRLFGVVFTISAFIGMVYALHLRDVGQHVAALLYAGSALGVVFAGDLLTLFFFWEMMAFSSVFLIWWGDRGKEAGLRYLLVHLAGGICLFLGILLHAASGQGLSFTNLGAGGLGVNLILMGFLLNAAVPPFHAWLADAYPEATIPGAVFLSAYTTKTAVYVLARGFAGTEMLIPLGVVMALYGVVYAVMENDSRRLLAYHIISQVGYMVAGIGIGTEMAINGAVAHAFSHILYKGLLFMGVGAVIFATGRRKLTELGGLYRYMPLTFILYMIGGFSISAFPLFSGFVSKSMVVSAAAETHRPYVTLLLTLASAGTFLHTGLKLPYYIFFGKESEVIAKEPPRNMFLGMGLAAALCIGIGIFPQSLYQLLPYPVNYHPYTATHVVWTLQILLFTALGFFMLLKWLDPEKTISIDTDWFYRKGADGFLWLTHHPIARYEGWVTELYRTALIRPILCFVGFCREFDRRVIDGIVRAVGSAVLSCAWFCSLIEKYVIYGLINLIGYANHLAARISRRLQTGVVNHYALMIIVGVFIFVNVYFVVRGHLPQVVAWK